MTPHPPQEGTMSQGYMSLVLHAHLPFVKHPEYPEFLEEDWYFEAAVETYLPLLEMFERLEADGVPYGMNLVVTPTLAAMMSDPHHQQRLRAYIEKTLTLLEREEVRLRGDAAFGPVAQFYRDRLTRFLDAYVNRYHCDLVGALRRIDRLGHLELITCAATHGLLPVLNTHPEAVRAQVAIGASEFARHFGRRPRGIWLPECGFTEGIEDFLADEDIRFFLVDTHCMQFADPLPVHGVYAPIYTPAGPAAFGRDAESSKQVWSSKEGYPGDAYYREFYRDVGYDLPFDYVREFVQPTGLRKQTGLKYHRITGDVDLSAKQPYIRGAAMDRVVAHAANFMFNRERQVEHLAGVLGRPPIVVAPYDAELFGHWWFEGPDFLEMFFRKAAFDQQVFECVNLSEYLRRHPSQQVATPATGSWGDKGYFEVWVNDKNDYVVRHLHHCADEMIALAEAYPDADGVRRRALNQCARELLLAQSSDWPFIITTGTMVDYAHRRVREHVLRFLRLASQVREDRIDMTWLGHLEHRDGLFPEIDYRLYRRTGQGGVT
jgi:1,4-alpha-glucan branching enzyme